MRIFEGSGVAIITPFNEDRTVDFKSLGRLIDFHLENGTDAIIVCGTTGESATLTEDEQGEIVEFSAKKDRRVYTAYRGMRFKRYKKRRYIVQNRPKSAGQTP
jgi:dihydrodipicolinate synthase/N-acetylneuraminate lyase